MIDRQDGTLDREIDKVNAKLFLFERLHIRKLGLSLVVQQTYVKNVINLLYAYKMAPRSSIKWDEQKNAKTTRIVEITVVIVV